MPIKFVERPTARGRIAQVRVYTAFQETTPPPRARVRPRPDRYDRFANRYQNQLVSRYEVWSKETERLVLGSLRRGGTPRQATTVMNARFEDLLVDLRSVGRQRIIQAGTLGLGRTFADHAEDPVILARLTDLQADNDRFLTESLIPALRERLTVSIQAAAELPDSTERNDAVRAGLLSGRTNVAPFAGAAILAIFEIQKLAGQQENVAREARGDPAFPVRWVLDPAAQHCQDDPVRGTFGCPGLARVYAEGWNSLVTVPAGNVSCLGNCRCHLEADFGAGFRRVD